MQFTTSTLAAVLAFTSSALASPIDARQSTLQDFQVTTAGSGTPSGRPGSYPWGTITAAVTDPNEYNLGTSEANGQAVIVPGGSQGLNCTAKWFTRNSESPLGRTWPCDPTENGFWTMEVLAGSQGQFSSGDFKLKFTHVPDVLYFGSRYTATITAEGAFKVGDNMQGSCGGSGVCGWGLKPEVKPVLLKATRA